MDLIQLIQSISAPDKRSLSPEFKVRSPKVRLVKTELFSVYEADEIPVCRVNNVPFVGALPRMPKNLKVILLGGSATGKTFLGKLVAKAIGGTLVDENDEGIAPPAFVRHTKSEQILENGTNAVVAYAVSKWQTASNSQLLETCAAHTLLIAVRSDELSRQHRIRTRKFHRVEPQILVGQLYSRKAVAYPSTRVIFSDIAQLIEPSKSTLACIDNPLTQSEVRSGLAFGIPIYSCFSILENVPLENLVRKYLPGKKDIQLKGKYHVTWQISNQSDTVARFNVTMDKMRTDIKALALIVGRNISLTVKVLHTDCSGKQVWMDTSPHIDGHLHITMHVGSGSTPRQSALDAHDESATVINVVEDVVVKGELRLARGDHIIDIVLQ